MSDELKIDAKSGTVLHRHEHGDMDHAVEHKHKHKHGMESGMLENILMSGVGRNDNAGAFGLGGGLIGGILIGALLGGRRGGLGGLFGGGDGEGVGGAGIGLANNIEQNEDTRAIVNGIVGVNQDVLKAEANLRQEVASIGCAVEGVNATVDKASWVVTDAVKNSLATVLQEFCAQGRATDAQFNGVERQASANTQRLTDVLFAQTLEQNNQFSRQAAEVAAQFSKVNGELCAIVRQASEDTSKILLENERAENRTQALIKEVQTQGLRDKVIEQNALIVELKSDERGRAHAADVQKTVIDINNNNTATASANASAASIAQALAALTGLIQQGNNTMVSALQNIHSGIANLNLGTQTLANSLNPNNTQVRV